MAVSFIESNLAYFGSDLDRQVKATSARAEKAWHAINSPLHIWRIEKFNVVAWPQELYGSFHTGDSYIVLRWYGNDLYNLHFWLGGESTIDEMGAAAYKTVELDTYLGGKPVQYREVQGRETQQFRDYFEKGIQILPGGVETGFRHVSRDEYATWLARDVSVTLNVTVRDLGSKVQLFMPHDVSPMQRYRGVVFVKNLLLHRPEVSVEHVYG